MNTATKLWNKNFMMFVMGMEFNLIGSELLKFALPLYIWLETGDPTLMGTVLAISSVSFIALTPVDPFYRNALDCVIYYRRCFDCCCIACKIEGVSANYKT